jgi:hypothetical protein
MCDTELRVMFICCQLWRCNVTSDGKFSRSLSWGHELLTLLSCNHYFFVCVCVCVYVYKF